MKWWQWCLLVAAVPVWMAACLFISVLAIDVLARGWLR